MFNAMQDKTESNSSPSLTLLDGTAESRDHRKQFQNGAAGIMEE
jgi:hypothetical protein